MALFDPKAKTIAQLQKSTDEKNVSINRYFDEIGRLYYGQYRDASADVSKDINSRCDAITALYTDIEANKLKILFEKGLKLCTSCKRENPLEHAFCSTCGAKFPEGSDKQVDLPVSITVVPVIPVSSEAEISTVPDVADEDKAPDSLETVPAETVHEEAEDEIAEVAAEEVAEEVNSEVEKLPE